MRRFSVLFAAAALAAALSSGCGAGVDNSEIVRSANPVGEMHRELVEKAQSEKDRVQWYSYEDAFVKARKEDKYIMVVFYATWCKWCKKFETETITDPEVAKALSSGFVSVRIDAESADKVVHEMRQMAMFELSDAYDVESFPTIWFLEPDGTRAKALKGYLGPNDFRDYLAYIKSGEYKEREF